MSSTLPRKLPKRRHHILYAVIEERFEVPEKMVLCSQIDVAIIVCLCQRVEEVRPVRFIQDERPSLNNRRDFSFELPLPFVNICCFSSSSSTGNLPDLASIICKVSFSFHFSANLMASVGTRIFGNTLRKT